MLRLILSFILLISFANALRKLTPEDIKPASGSNDGDWNLVFLQALWRHGDRSPIYHIPGDKTNASDWTKGGGGYGQLTPIYVRSTDVNRTLISAMSNMVGFFSQNADRTDDFPGNLPGWPKNYVPIPIHTVPEEWDPVLGVYNCPFEKTVHDKLHASDEFVKAYKDNKVLLDKLNKLTGVNVTLEQVIGIADTLFIEKTWHRHLPDGYDALYDDIRKLAGIVDDFEDGINVTKIGDIDFSMELPRLNGGPLLWTIVDHLNQKRYCLDKKEGRSDADNRLCRYFDTLKYYVFSAHDTTISSLFSTFGFKYANYNESDNAVTIELYQSKDGKNYKVEVLYWPGAKDPGSVTGSISGCEKGCTLEQFTDRSKPYKIEDMDKYCKRNSGSNGGTDSSTPKSSASNSQLFSVSLLFVLTSFFFSLFK